MVARFAFVLVSLAQKPKSATNLISLCERFLQLRKLRTDLNTTMTIQKNIVTFDVTMDDILSVKMC